FTDELSVHLADFPDVPEQYKNDELVLSIELVQDAITLARSIRNKNRVKNRQPLSMMQLAMSDASKLACIRAFTDVIAGELNVKKVVLSEDVGDIATVKYDPNFAVINATCDRAEKGKVIQAIKSRKYRLEGNSAILQIDGEEKVYDASIILVTYIAKEGLFVASQNGMIASLDLTVTEELRTEGIAREIIRNVQDARKQIGCAITDRIVLDFVEGEAPANWVDFICGETLAEVGTVDAPLTTVEISDSDGTIRIAIAKK
ncbi:MAG: isoleucine--tRNA ligase, partial [Clostridia bacterium]|nr:isoleucine--tRNA ligase [Clostridia bacterium]